MGTEKPKHVDCRNGTEAAALPRCRLQFAETPTSTSNPKNLRKKEDVELQQNANVRRPLDALSDNGEENALRNYIIIGVACFLVFVAISVATVALIRSKRNRRRLHARKNVMRVVPQISNAAATGAMAAPAPAWQFGNYYMSGSAPTASSAVGYYSQTTVLKESSAAATSASSSSSTSSKDTAFASQPVPTLSAAAKSSTFQSATEPRRTRRHRSDKLCAGHSLPKSRRLCRQCLEDSRCCCRANTNANHNIYADPRWLYYDPYCSVPYSLSVAVENPYQLYSAAAPSFNAARSQFSPYFSTAWSSGRY